MSESSPASVADRPLPAPSETAADGWRLVAKAPPPETPDAPRGAGARRGLLIALATGVAFWGAVAVGVARLAA